MIELSEAQVKQAVEEYLMYAMNQGKLWFCRLNAGDIYIQNKDGSHRLFKGVGKGTADFIVIQGGNAQMYYLNQPKGTPHPIAFVTFIEVKSTKGKQSPDQLEFEAMITKLHCWYVIVRSVEELQEALERE